MPEQRTTDLLLLRSRSRSRMLRSQSETRSGERRTSRRRIKLHRRKSNRIPSRASQGSSVSSSERAVLSERVDVLEAFWRDRLSSAVVETPERKHSRRRSRSSSNQQRRNKSRPLLHPRRGKRTAEHEKGGAPAKHPSPHTYGRKRLSHRLAKQRMCIWISPLFR